MEVNSNFNNLRDTGTTIRVEDGIEHQAKDTNEGDDGRIDEETRKFAQRRS